jgi:predicted transcriptional regulator
MAVIGPDAPMAEVMRVLTEHEAVAVAEGGGRTLGKVSRENVLARLADPRSAAERG